MIYIQHNNHNDETSVRFALTKDTPYLAITGKLWDVFRKLFDEKWLRYIYHGFTYQVNADGIA